MKRLATTVLGFAGLLALASVAATCASGGDDSRPGGGGTTGGAAGAGAAAGTGGTGAGATAGSGGSPSTGGSAGTGASATTGGSAGTGASASTGGSAGTGASPNTGGSPGTGGTPGTGGAPGTGGNGGSPGTGGTVSPGTGGLGPASFATGEIDAPSNGGTYTFEQIGAVGWFPSRRDPAVGPCDVTNTAGCCQGKLNFTTDQLTPWGEDLIWSLRGPVIVKQLAAYQPDAADKTSWPLVSAWDKAAPTAGKNVGFSKTPFDGYIVEGQVDWSTGAAYPCGTGIVPWCPASSTTKYWGWKGPKLFVILAWMPYADSGKFPTPPKDTTGGWFNAPWFGLSHGEMVRTGAYGSCHCYAKDGAKWYLADGCGQFNVFEVVNDNNSSQNFHVFSTNMFGYGGYVGQGPCGTACGNTFPAAADLIDKSTKLEAAAGAICTPAKAPGAAFKRPEGGYRYFITLLDVDTRQVQLAIVHPQKIPPALAPLLPGLPGSISRATVDSILGLRLPK